MQLLAKRTVACCMVAVAGGVFASWPFPAQKIEVYTSTDATNFDPADATLVLKSVPRLIDIPFGDKALVFVPQCVQGAALADCAAATGVYDEVQGAAKALGDRQLGNNGWLPVIMMKNNHPNNTRGLYDPSNNVIVLYPNAGSSTAPHETGHVYFRKHFGKGCVLPCNEAEIKKWGVDEGFAMILAHHMTGSVYSSPSANSVGQILASTKCRRLYTSNRAQKCAHDLGFLVFKAYKKIADDRGTDYAYEVYLERLNRLREGGVAATPASLHRAVREAMVDRDAPTPPPTTILPPDPDPFALYSWLDRLKAYGIYINYIVD